MDKLASQLQESNLPFKLYLIYLVSFFLHIPARIPLIGMIRIDLLLVVFIFFCMLRLQKDSQKESLVFKCLLGLLVYGVLVLPFTSWPGTVLIKGIPNFIKAVIFFFFTYALVINEERLKKTIYVFLICNTIRVIEPLYLHLTEGYWGSETSFGWDMVPRLAGAPSDVINANGLAFVIASILPFFHYLFGSSEFKYKLIYWLLTPVLLYTMSLTLSRSGILAVAIIYGVIFLKSKHKFIFVILGFVGVIIFFGSLDSVQRDRYLSIVNTKDTASGGSADGRVSGWTRDFEVAMVKPIFGHGLGTSAEANWNIAGESHKSHNLWLEVLQELGIVGLIIFIVYVKAIYQGFKRTSIAITTSAQSSLFIRNCLPAMQVWLMMNFLFSFASYGLSSYEWYLFGAFSAIMQKLSAEHK